jgi:response regulator RpfG family c-di-GMP phosphodiesterase
MADKLTATRKIHLLLVDDEPAILRSLTRLFRQDAYEIYCAESGAQALDLLAEQNIDVIISDMQMPGISGLNLLKQAESLYPDVPRIVLSGYADPQSVMGVVNDAKIFSYVKKPWDEQDLKLKVSNAAEQRYLKQLTENQSLELQTANNRLESRVRERTEQLMSTQKKLLQAMTDMKSSYQGVVRLLSHFSHLTMPVSIRGQARRVATIAKCFATALGLPKSEVDTIETAALLQNIGLIGCADELQTRPEAELTGEQHAEWKKHPIMGETLLSSIPVMQEVSGLVRSHHEHYDGSGWPDHLAGLKIPQGARICLLAQQFVDLSDSHASETSTEVVLALMATWVGQRYDPTLWDSFCSCIRGDDLLMAVGTENQTLTESSLLRVLDSQDLEPGMVLHRNLMSKAGALLLTEGSILSQKIINRIIQMEKMDRNQYQITVAMT